MSITSCLRLFNVVPAAFGEKYHLDTQLGIVIAPSAIKYKNDIISFYDENKTTSDKLNKTFYQDWQTLFSKSYYERVVDQICHYFTTYGFEALGIYDPEYVYVPNEGATNVPKDLRLFVVKGVAPQELIKSCLDMLAAGIALKQETIEDILSVLAMLDYKFTGNEKIANKEARIIIADLTGVLPVNPDDLFRYFIYKATNESLVIKNEKMKSAIVNSGYRLPFIDEARMEALATSFNRNKPLWVSFKFAHKNNRKTVNRISKLSKKKHVPMPVNVLGALTHTEFSKKEILNAANNATVFQIVRAINAIRLYKEGVIGRVYRIRNGKTYVTNKGRSKVASKLAENYLLDVLRSRTGDKKIFVPEDVDYAVPVSEKMFAGNVPLGTSILTEATKNGFLLTGIYWEDGNYRTDIDLSANSLGGTKYGWNASWKNSNQTIGYSGDMTSASNGAAEWLYFQNGITDPFLVSVNLFSGEMGQTFKFIVGKSKEAPETNYMVDPNDVVFEVENTMEKKQINTALIEPAEGKVRVTLMCDPTTNSRVSRHSGETINTMEIMLASKRTALKMSEIFDVVDNKDDADIDLSLDRVTKEDFITKIWEQKALDTMPEKVV